ADDGHFAHVELLLACHHAERLVDRIDFGEVQDNPLGFDVAFFQRPGVRVSSETDAQSLDLFSSDSVHAGSSRVSQKSTIMRAAKPVLPWSANFTPFRLPVPPGRRVGTRRS